MTQDPPEAPPDLLYAREVFLIQGAVFEVNRVMGAGFLEAVYHECLGLEFAARGISFRSTPQLALAYKSAKLQQTYSPDFVCFDSIIVELKAVRELVTAHRAQVLNYLRATGLRVGLLVNFGAGSRATVERLIL